TFRRNNTAWLAAALARLGEPAAAAERAEALATLGVAPAEDAYNAAGVFALCAAAAGRATGQAETAGRYARRAVELLRQAVRPGFRDHQRLSTDPAFAGLRDAPELRTILDELRAR